MSALTIKKIQAAIETILWLVAVIAIVCVSLPIAAVMGFAGFVLRLIHVEFAAKITDRFMKALIGFIVFVTKRIRMRTREIEALRAQ